MIQNMTPLGWFVLEVAIYIWTILGAIAFIHFTNRNPRR